MSRRNLIIGGLVLFVVVGAGIFYWFQQQQGAAIRAVAQRQTATLTRGELTATVSGAGNISAPQQASLNFGLNGVRITRVNVKIGDQVKAGDLLAQADDTPLQEALKTAEANLASARANLEALQSPPTAEELQAAEAQVASAQANYDAAVASLKALQEPPSADKVKAAQLQLASAQAAYEEAAQKFALSNDQITVARASLEKARLALQSAQAAYNAIAWRDDAPNSAQAAALQQATIDYEAAQANYNLTLTSINDAALKQAEQALVQARLNLDTLLAGPTADQLASAKAAVHNAEQSLAQAKLNLETLKRGPTAEQLAAAQATLQAAQANYEAAKRNLEQAKIIAPFDGTIAGVNIAVGLLTGANTPAMVLVNLQDLEIKVNLSEVDIAQVKPGQQVRLTFDALGGRTFSGKVLSISPLGTTTQGVVNYMVTIGLTRPDPAILPGMTASASIIVAQRQNVLLAPNRAVRTQGTRRTLTLLFEGREIPVLVQTGLTGDQYTEIVSAATTDGQPIQLQEGDTVVLTTTTTQPGGFGPGGPGFFPGGFR